MNLELSDLHQSIQRTARDFARSRLASPLAWEEQGELPADLIDELGAMGFLGMSISEEAGGSDLDRLAVALVVSELASGHGTVGLLVATHNATLAGPARSVSALEEFATGQRVATVPGPNYVRLFRPDRAHVFDSAGNRIATPDDTELSSEALGFRAAAWRRCASATVPSLELDLYCAALSVGLGESAVAASTEYARERRQFGRPIADFQAIQWMIADSTTELSAARWMVLRAAVSFDPMDIAKARRIASRVAIQAGDRALQIHGGYGYTRDFAVERHLRDARAVSLLHTCHSKSHDLLSVSSSA